ncbi:dolichyl-phosphate-mannose-protein mannosyltransferase [Geosmithia morbida]|uniref:Dolichyl-phosphate-mannose--protein mannosyltransferase n=1 Tax=Geosmithia morbida TaxID=1094350 RepID=A0A9P4YPZ3_9HYPO|nr:dolichyl-phosphate-mannose-protein mannosyltransferase [Geosmithia morbida]KAF4119890.1 dolichyl-phosphate-mannose-protein mannosyltransferase [Geosmithia morbida]
MARSNAARGRSPQPPVDSQFANSPTLAVPGSVKKPKSRSRSRSRNNKKSPKAKKGDTSYKSDGVEDNDVFLLPLSDYYIAFFMTIVAVAVRIYKIYQPSSVVFDEVHFGGFATKYIKGRFFMDVHPPLAKMLFALTGWLAGFDGNFDFKEIGKDYIEPNVPYVAMRMFPAICGALVAPIIYLTLKTVGCRSMTALMGSGLIIFENGLLTQARLILLDSPLVFATAFTALAFNAFTNQHELGPEKAFSLSWWFWLISTGIGLGITVSIKWVGFLTIAWVGLLTLVQLWVLLGDSKNVSMRCWFKHFMARAFALIGIPVTIYLGMFAIHFMCLVNPGDGDGFMSSEFQASLNSKKMRDVPADVVMGSRVSIRHVNTQGGYLHSHPLMYPTGSKQQQITLYPHKDENNIWILENQTQPLGIDGEPIEGIDAWDHLPGPEYVKDGSTLRLYHINTHRRLHSHDHRPPVTEVDWQNEVSAYGYEGFPGDANDYFRVEIVGQRSKAGVARERVRTIETKFRLVHVMSGCVLFSHKVKLPDWATGQQEVTCARGGSMPNSLWYVEYNESPHLGEDSEKVNYEKLGFWGKFWELQAVMQRTNAGLTETHTWDSRPHQWPLLRRGINFWGRSHTQVYLMGNPVIWWSSFAAIATWVVFKAIAVLRWQRNYNDYSSVTFKRFDYEVGTSVLGWALHYFPFFLMERQLFLHHYFPALYFGIIALCQVVDFSTARIPGIGVREHPIINRVTTVSILALSIAAFIVLSPLAYGSPWTKAECNRVKLFPTWDFDCNKFYEADAGFPPQYDQYTYLTVAAGSAPSDAPAVKAEEQPAYSQRQPEEPPAVSASPPEPQAVEEKVEYRDQDGNLLNAEQVQALRDAGEVRFETKYEVRTRVVDEDGNDVDAEESDSAETVAPPHPDIENVDQETVQADEPESNTNDILASRDGEKESLQKEPKPASEGQDATKHDEL